MGPGVTPSASVLPAPFPTWGERINRPKMAILVDPPEGPKKFTTLRNANRYVRKGRAVWTTLNKAIRILRPEERVVTATGRPTSRPSPFKILWPGNVEVRNVVRDGATDLRSAIPHWPTVGEVKKRESGKRA